MKINTFQDQLHFKLFKLFFWSSFYVNCIENWVKDLKSLDQKALTIEIELQNRIFHVF